MKSIFLTASALFCIVLAIGSLQSLWIDLQLKALTEPEIASKTVKSRDGGSFVRDRELAALRELRSSPLHDATVHVRIFSLLNQEAAGATNGAERVRLYCEALSEIGTALHSEPANASYLMNWANVRQILGSNVQCSLPYTSGSFEAAAQLALRNDPTNVNVLFAAAQLYEWAGKNEESLARLNRTLLLSTSLKPFQTEYISSRIRTPEDAEAIIPARFPQVANWSEHVQRLNPELFRNSRAVFEKLQLAAIEESRSEYKNGSVPPEIHKQRLLSLFACAASPEVRRRLDTELASFSRYLGDEKLTTYLLERGALFEAEVLEATIDSDTRPLKSVLAAWGANPEVCLDDFYTSLGFYLPQGESPKLIELHGRRLDAQLAPTVLKVLVSDDNQNWSELEGNVTVSSAQFGDSKLVAIHPNSRYYKYWKINFSSSLRSRAFCNSAQRMLTVYRSTGSAR